MLGDLPEESDGAERVGVRGYFSAPRFLRRHLRQRTRSYWRYREFVRKAEFRLSRLFWRMRRTAQTGREQLPVASAFARVVALPFGASLLAVAVLAIADRYLFPAWLARALPNPVDASLLSVTTALAGIGGAFLGLYFTAVSVVASTSYRDAPEDVRRAVLNERMGDSYLRVVAAFTAVSVILSALLVFEVKPGRFNVIVLVILGTAAVFAFVPLGRRAFSYFDPVMLVDVFSRELLVSADLAGSRKNYREQASFQASYHRNASHSVAMLESIVNLALRAAFKDSVALRGVALEVLSLFNIYVSKKSRIPPDSLWFPRRPEFRSWLTGDGTYIEVALRTGTQMPPKDVVDRHWMEKRLAAILGSIVEALSREGNYEDTTKVSLAALQAIQDLATADRFDEARLLGRSLVSVRLPVRGGSSDSQALARRAVLDCNCRATVGLIVGVGLSAEKTTVERITAWVAGERSRAPGQDVSSAPPDTVRESMEMLKKSASFEMEIDGRNVTPEWFWTHVVSGVQLKHLFDCLKTILADIRRDYLETAESIATSEPVDAMQLVQTGLEACRKLAHFSTVVFSASERLKPLMRTIGEHVWPSPPAGSMQTDVDAVVDGLIAVLAQVALNLPRTFEQNSGPDDFGYAYVTLAEESVRAICRKEAGVETVFPTYFAAALAAHDRVREELSEYPVRVRTVFSTTIVEDLCDISGYALVLNDLGVSSPWLTVRAMWEAHLGSIKDPAGFLRSVVSALTYVDGVFEVTTRAIVRQGWGRLFAEYVSSLGLLERPMSPFGGPAVLKTGGALSQAYFDDTMTSGHDVFLACYLATLPAFKGIALPRNAAQFAEDVARPAAAPPDEDVDNVGP